MKVVYIAGPFRAASKYTDGQDMFEIHKHIMYALDMAVKVWRLGAAALCPHANTFPFTGSAPDSIWLEGDKELLRRCDAILMVPGWQKSSGAIVERALAEALRLPVFYDTDDAFVQWLRS